MYNKKTVFIEYVKEHGTVYLFMIILFLTGIVFGAMIVNSMNFIQKQDLFFYLERFFGEINDQYEIAKADILKNSFLYHAKYLFIIFILGLSVIGLPIVWILLFLKGLVVGFSVGFLVNQLGMKGLLLASLSIAPQNMIIIPIYIIAGSLSMIFSLTLLNKIFSHKMSQPIFQPLARYIVLFSFLLTISFVASCLEAFVANEAMGSFIRSFIKQ
ncbi:MAG TPA: stage II sporulation protein M [Bacillota bacterium]|nr:stage II sporulation protein M [Bacillota bacterium]